MKILFYGAKPAGATVLQKLVELGHEIVVVPDKTDSDVGPVAKELSLQVLEHESLNSPEFVEKAKSMGLDLIVCCHGREILGSEILGVPSKGAINLHPCLYKFPGARPIKRFLESGEKKASVAAHFMEEKVDSGSVICELFIDIGDAKSEEQVYKLLYPLYADCVEQALRKIK